MVEYAVLTARSATHSFGVWTQQVRPEQVVAVVAVLILGWMVWRIVSPR